jgi:hypothetical protein
LIQKKEKACGEATRTIKLDFKTQFVSQKQGFPRNPSAID